jgi:hypothetical protein
MSLAGDTIYRNDSVGEPPESIVGYGSLRDSHEKGRFLDGPSSYREPTSGRIRQLDHRLRYHGRQPELSIGERMQQARKLKERRQKEQQEQTDKAQAAAGATTTTSSLSAMMSQVVSKESSTEGAESQRQQQQQRKDFSAMEEEFSIPVKTNESSRTTMTTATTATLFDNDIEDDDRMMDSPFMLSTSLTAFEILKTSNIRGSSRYGNNMLSQSTSGVASARTFNSTGGGDGSEGTQHIQYPQRFQPLARSMSDPTPRFQQMSLREISSNNTGAPLPPSPLLIGAQHQQQQQQLGPSAIAAATAQHLQQHHQQQPMSAIHGPYTAPSIPDYGFVPAVTTTTINLPDHDPDTDGAFGDMDME